MNMVSRYGGRKEPTVHCFMAHCAPPQQHPPPPPPPPPAMSQFRIIPAAANTGRPEVGFHVAQPGFAGPQQGNGPNPGHPGGPQGMSRQMHHPVHHGGPPGPGNPSLAPPGPAGGPGQQGGQVQQPQQSQGPAPTSTPPGQDMGKQPPHMQQGQSQMPQGSQMQLSYGMTTAQRPGGSQNYYGNARGPTPRMANHRGQIVNMQATHGQIYSQVPIQGGVLPQMYSSQVVPQLQQQMFVQSLPMYQNQPPRHQNHASTGYFTAPQQILMTHQQLYSGYQQHNPQHSQQYYFPAANPVGLPRPGSGVPGGPGPQMSQPQPQQVVQGGPPPQQMGQPGQVPMTMVPSGPPVGVPPSIRPDSVLNSSQSSKARRKFALDIVDPKTGKNINDEIYEGSTASSPPGSENSSARQTPQPNSGSAAMDLIADFAARVAKVASEDNGFLHLQSFAESSPSPPSEEILNGPPNSDISSIEDQPSSIPINVSVEENQWQTTQSKHTLKSDLVSEEEIATKLDNVDNNNIKLVTEVDISFAKEFVPQLTPSVSLKDIPLANSKILETKEHVPESQPIPVVINKEPQPIIETNSTPVVSANANTPSFTLVHKSSNKDSFPALKTANNQPNQSLSQSPRRKPGSRETNSAERSVVPNSSFTPNPAVSTSQTPEVKVPKKEEFAVPQVPQPKERREKEKKDRGGRGRGEKSSQSRERADKNRASSERIPSKSRERDNERKNSLQSRERESDKSQPREKRSQSRESDKPVSKKEVELVKTPSPSPVSEPESTVLQKPVAQLPSVVRSLSPPTATEEVIQPNGETNVDMSDGKGVKQHQQNAKSAKRNKMRSDQSARKGVEKEPVEEGTVAPPPVAEEVSPVAPPAPSPVAPALGPPQADTPSPPPQPPTPPAVAQVVPDDPDAEQKEVDESDKIVLARNEENTKLTAAAAAAKEDVPTIIENMTEIKTIQAPPPPKLLPYSDDQWSPLNPEGKKKYERDFLMELKEDPKSKKKPENLPDLEVVLKDTSNRPRGGMMDGRALNRSNNDSFTPGFMRSGGGGQSNSRGPVTKRGSQQGKPSKGGKPAVIHLSLSLREDVKLHETENAWKPTILKKPDPRTDTKTEDLYKKVRGVLNKLTPQKFDTLVSQVQSLPIDNSDRLQGVINLVFEKAVDEPNFSVAYAQMCKVLSGIQVPAERKSAEDPEFVNFRKLLVNRCQTEFEKNNEAELNREAKLGDINAQADPERKKELQLLFEEEERRIRMKSVGNIRFIGELFKLQMLTTSIMHRCIRHLLSQGDEESLEGLCKLLTTIGRDLESKTGPSGNPNDLSMYFSKMKEIASKKGPNSVSSRVRFMLQDVIELRQGKWIPRRDDANPKTMDQIQKEAEKETMDMHLALSNAPNTPRRQDDRGGMGDRDRRGGKSLRGGGDVGQQQDGWQSVPARTRNLVVDTSKIKVKHNEIENVSLGSGTQFRQWSRGAGSAVKVEDKKSSQQSFGNKFSVLEDSSNITDDKKGPPLPSQRQAPGKVTPSPSMENERMLSYKTPSDVSNRSSRSSSVQQSSRSSSRDNSARRNDFSRSQPGSVSASNEDISRPYPDKVVSLVPSKAQELSSDDIQKKSRVLIEEFLSNNLYSDCTENVLETFIPSQRHEFVREFLNAVLEKTSHSRINVGEFMCHLVKHEVINITQYLQGLQAILEIGDDIAIDVPKIWLYLAETVVPVMSSELLSFTAFSLVVKEAKATQLVLEVLQLLVKDKGPNWIRERWDGAGLKWTDFLEAGLVDAFVKNNKLEYTVGGAVNASMPAASSSLTMDQIRQKLASFLIKIEQGSNSSSFDHIYDWISANVGDRVKEPQFIRALMTAICENAIQKHPSNSTWKLKESELPRHQPLLLKYIDHRGDLELQCIYAIQELDHALEHPQGLLCSIFQQLYDDNMLSADSFYAWEESTDPAEQSGKGVALKSLTSFFTTLKEGDSSCDES